MNRVCPYCESVGVSAEQTDKSDHLNQEGVVFRCRACGRSSLPGAVSLGAAAAPRNTAHGIIEARPPGATGRHKNRGAPGEVASLPAGAFGLLATLIFYGLLHLMPASGFSDLFISRGWVPYVITLISIWALFLLGARMLRLRGQRRVLEQELVLAAPDGRLRPDDANSALVALHAAPAEIAKSFLAGRLERALRHFRSRRRAVEVVEFLASESRADEVRVDASYGLVRVFVWAVPTLGFIGTVIGIGAAVAGFSETLEAASSLDGMKESIGLVTGGLGVAFDTTLLALVMSILIMFPASAVQRIEEAFLADVDDYCAEFLVPKLLDESNELADDAVIAALARRLTDAMRAGEKREG